MLEISQTLTEVNRPYSCPAADVESAVDVCEWREVELLVDGEPYYVVLEVCLVSLAANATYSIRGTHLIVPFLPERRSVSLRI